jgi:hypothetical protein
MGDHPLPFTEFLRRARTLHGDRYDYSLAGEQWGGARRKVVLICPEHGRFEQLPRNHLQGHGCVLCGHLRRALALRYDLAHVIRRAEERFPQYRLETPSYRTVSEPAEWWCTRHHCAFQATFAGLMGQTDGGCPRCLKEAQRERRRAARHHADAAVHVTFVEDTLGSGAAHLYRDWLTGDTLAELGRRRGISGEAARQQLARIQGLLDKAGIPHAGASARKRRGTATARKEP